VLDSFDAVPPNENRKAAAGDTRVLGTHIVRAPQLAASFNPRQAVILNDVPWFFALFHMHSILYGCT
jgi:hypothetical protein